MVPRLLDLAEAAGVRPDAIRHYVVVHRAIWMEAARVELST
jgi:hypothetical protein